jgi:hypothetical protein
MKALRYFWLVGTALRGLMLYDIAYAVCGFERALRLLGPAPATDPTAAAVDPAVCDAVLLATCLYWKPVMCLQRSFCLARLLRAHGVPARLVIGYRPVPFFSHAWVEVGGRVVNDSPVYRQLRVLYTL